MQQVLYSRVMTKESPPLISLIIFGWVATALFSGLFKWSLVFHFSIDNLQNLTILLFVPSSCIHSILSYAERCQMLSGNEHRLYLNSCSSFFSPHILLLMSLIDPCNIYFQDDTLFSLLVVNSALPDLWGFLWLFYLWSCRVPITVSKRLINVLHWKTIQNAYFCIQHDMLVTFYSHYISLQFLI